jgi:uncharacterized phage protein (TIGR01671 family)
LCMKREIKFRAWDRVAKAMSPEFVLFGEFTLMGAVHAWQDEVGEKIKIGDSLGRLNDLDIMQYTGMKDKNGKEIYEGDRLKRRVTDFLVEASYVDFNCDVAWNGWCYGLCIGGKQLWGLDPITSKECEVIGNIYENQKGK